MLLIKMLLKCINCGLVTCVLHLMIILCLVADGRVCHYCHLHSKVVC
jgi:hypothetical protein